jgi:heme/copper-type cytochrome/quinol oxidase subunit 2
MKNLKDWVMAFVLWVVVIMFVISMSSCSSQRVIQHDYVQMDHDTIPSYFYANNQIVIVEKNR